MCVCVCKSQRINQKSTNIKTQQQLEGKKMGTRKVKAARNNNNFNATGVDELFVEQKSLKERAACYF